MNLNNFLQFNNIIPLDGDGYIDIFGYRFRSDDLLIFAIMAFLYSQKVSDKYLFIALILLLLN